MSSFATGRGLTELDLMGATPAVLYLLGTAYVSFDQLAHLHTVGVVGTSEFRRALGLPTGESA